MHSRIVLVLSMLTSIACGSKSSDRRDSAILPNDSSPGKDSPADMSQADMSQADMSQADFAVADGPSPDVAGSVEAAARDTSGTEAGRDTALPEAPVGLDGSTQEAARDVSPLEAIGAKDGALDGGRDGSGPSTNDALAAFCTGDILRSMVNGTSGAPALRTSRIATGCCDGFELRLDSATFVSSIYVTAISSGGFLPADIDLGNLPKDWTFRVSSDCDSTSSSCKEQYASGFVGSMQLSRVDGSSAIDMSLCLHAEDTDGTHKLRTFDLYIPHGLVN
jgi:hypothetical protein